MRSWSSSVPLKIKNTPPKIKMRSRPEKLSSNKVNNGVLSVISQDMMESNPNRINKARDQPSTRARSRNIGGNVSTKIAIQMTLTTPSTSSTNMRVNKPAHAVGSSIHSIKDL